MAPIKTPNNVRGRRRGDDDLHLEDPGNIGRHTGIEMPQFSRDENQYESLSDYFPTTGKGRRAARKSQRLSAQSEDMEMQESSGPEVTETLNLRSAAKSASKPPPHSRSPIKTSLGTPLRPSSSGRQSSFFLFLRRRSRSSQRDDVPPKLDLTMGRSPRQPYTPRFRNSTRRSQEVSSQSLSPEIARRTKSAQKELPDDTQDTTIEHVEEPTEDSDGDDAAEVDFENDTLAGMQPKAVDPPVADEDPPSSTPRRSKRKADHLQEESMLSNADAEADAPQLIDDDEALPEPHETQVQPEEPSELPSPTPNNDKAPSKKRGRKPTTAAIANSKRPRKNPSKDPKQPLDPSSAQPSQKTKASTKTKPLARKDANARSTPPTDSDFKRPGTPGKPSSNVRERREGTAEDDSEKRTRSGRTVYKPLEYWRGEKAILKAERGADGATVRTLQNIIRMEDVTPVKRQVSRSVEPPKKQRRRRKKADTIFEEEAEHASDASDDPEDAFERWEREEGFINGLVHQYDALADVPLDAQEQQQIAIAGPRMQLRDGAEGTFSFNKAWSGDFFGSGMLELPPGGIKRSKNSRRMQMMFFVHYGKVTFEINETVFIISKGGVVQTPRGNNYSISNDTEHPAKLFFSQACELEAEVVGDLPAQELPEQQAAR